MASTTEHQSAKAANLIDEVRPTDLETPGEAAQLRQAWAELESLEEEWRCATAELRSPESAARWLEDYESRLSLLSASTVRLEPDRGIRPVQASLFALSRWLEIVTGSSLTDAAAKCHEASRRLLADEARAWYAHCRELAAQATAAADDCFAAWMHGTALQLDAVVHPDADATIVESLCAARQLAREALLRSLLKVSTGEPGQELRLLTATMPDLVTRMRWTTELADRSDVLLTAIDDLSPRKAAAQLELLSDDLAWHRKQIERQRGRNRRRLGRKRRRLRAEAQERVLQTRLEERFGRSFVAGFERLMLVLIFVVLGLLVVEAAVPLEPQALLWLNLADGAICAVFLVEFGVKLAMAPDRKHWFWRHALIDLVPSIPFGLFLHGLEATGAIDAVQGGRFFRLLRLPRLGRYVYILRPMIRAARGFGFMARGMDRLASRYGTLLNRNVILYPTAAERRRAREDAGRLVERTRRLQAEVRQYWERLLQAEGVHRELLAERRIAALENSWKARPDFGPIPQRLLIRQAREIPVEAMLRRMGAITPHDVAASLGTDLTARLARTIRTFARPPLRWMPILRKLVPELAPQMTDAEVVAAGSRRAAIVFKFYFDRWFWLADLHGTLIPSEFVDRLGTMLVKSSFRPAYKLLLFGGVYLLVQLLLNLAPYEFLNDASAYLKQFVGSALKLLGGLCFCVLVLGWWLKRLAREATEFYERAAQAQFLSLTEIIRSRHLARDAEILHDRVLRPEWELEDSPEAQNRQQQIGCFVERVQQSLTGDFRATAQGAAFDMLERTVMLYRDSLDGALFVDSDNRTTCQLLGNPSVRQFLALSQRVGRREARALSYLDLERQKSLFGGPYLWFNFISRAVAHSVASLIVEYNRQAIPLAELPLESPVRRNRYNSWLTQSDSQPFPREPLRAAQDESSYVTTAFTALHFLDFDPQRDREVSARFGTAVLERMRRDRSLLVRRVFGTYPWHLQPKEVRVLNPLGVYERWLSGGKALLLPLWISFHAARSAYRVLRWIGRAILEVRRPDLRVDRNRELEADFTTAVRKIERMRGPVVHACLRLRSLIDPEYLGVAIPNSTRPASAPDQGFAQPGAPLAGADLITDLRFLDVEPWVAAHHLQQRDRAEADMRRLGKLIDDGLLGRLAVEVGLPPEAFDTVVHRRAAASAYLADFRGLRRRLSAKSILEEVFAGIYVEQPGQAGALFPIASWWRFRRYCRQHGIHDREVRRRCWRAVRHNLWGVADSLAIWAKRGDAARAEGERLLAEILRHPGRITEQLVTLRTVQTLSILDILIYREHIFQLGSYGRREDLPCELLQWETTRREVLAERTRQSSADR